MKSNRRQAVSYFHARNTALLERLESRLLLTAITQYHVDLQSTGVDSTETVITPANVGSLSKQFSTPVDGQVYGEPLYVPGVNITSGSQQGVHNVAYVVTQGDTLYAIDSDGGNILWSTHFPVNDATGTVSLLNPLGATAMTTVPSAITSSSDITPQFGITATPVIDQTNNSLYIIAASQQTIAGNANNYVQIFYKVNIQSGAITNSTVVGDTIYNGSTYTYVTAGAASTTPYVFGTGDGSVTVSGKSVIYFNALREMDRPGLTLVNGVVYLAFASHGDNGPYHGWMLGYNENSLALNGVLNTTPNGGLGGIWQGGGIIDYDPETQAFFFETGNGSFNENASNFPAANDLPGTNYALPLDGDYGDSFVKVQLDPTTTATNQNINGWGLKITDFFSPTNNNALSNGDTDLGSGGPTILPDAVGSTAHPELLVGAGKSGVLYLIDREKMGGYSSSTDNMVQEVGGALTGQLNDAAFFLNNPSPAAPAMPSGTLLVVMGYGSGARAFNISNGVITVTPTSSTAVNFGDLSGSPTVSADGTANAIMWVISRNDSNLYAYDANNLGNLLWYSGTGNNNGPGSDVKFTVPTVADGEVFVGTANSLVVYGPPAPPTFAPAAPSNLTATAPAFNTVNLSWQDNSSNESSFLIDRTTTPNNPASWTQIATVGANVTTYTDTTALATTSYSYEVQAYNTYNGGSDSPFTNVATVTTPQAPSAGTGDGAAVAFWNLPSGDNIPALPISIATLGTPVLTEVDPTIDYNWGTNSPGSGVDNVYYAALFSGRIQAQFSQTYTFSASVNDGVVLMISPAGANTWTTVLTHWTNGGLMLTTGTYAMSAGAQYDFQMEYYQATATAQAHLSWSSPSTPEEIIPQSQIYSGTAPAAPSNLTGLIQASYEINLNWQNNSTIATGIVVQRSDNSGPFNTVATLASTATSYIDTGLNPNYTYSYQVQALNFAADSPDSNVVTLTTPIPPNKPTDASATSVTTSAIDIQWTDNANNETGYRILRAGYVPGQQDDNFNTIALLPPDTNPAPSIDTYDDTGATIPIVAGTEYDYHIEAYNLGGYNDFAGFTTETITNAPTNLMAAGGNGQVALTWAAPTFNSVNPSDLTFNVYRTTNSNGSGAMQIATGVETPTYTDTAAVNGTTYYYTLTAVDLGGESVASNQAHATPAMASQIAFTTTAQTIIAGVVSGPITVELKDASGNAVTAGAGGQVINLASTSGTGTFLDSANNAVTALTIAAGSSTGSVTYIDTAAGGPTLTASTTGLTSAMQMETVETPTANQRYVIQIYSDILHRVPDAAGFTYWSAQLDGGAPYQVVALGLSSSMEYYNRVVNSYYEQYLGRAADTPGLNHWSNSMVQGASAETIRVDIVSSQEFYNDGGGTAAGYVTELYTDLLDRTPDTQGLTNWEAVLQSNGSAAVAGGFIYSLEYYNIVIGGFYETYLHRAATAGELTTWTNDLLAGINEQTIISDIVSLPEYLTLNNIT